MSATWTDVETAFLERFKRSDAASAMDLQRIKQEDNEDVQAFAERFSRIQARFPGTPEGVKVAQFRSKIHKKFDQVMAANMPKTLRTAVNLARCAEDDMNNQKAQEDELYKRAREIAQTMVKNQSGKDTKTNQVREKDNHNYYRQERTGNWDRNRNYQSQDHRNDGAGRNHGPPPRGLPPQQRNGAVPMEVDMAQARGRDCFKCGRPGHMARNCPNQAPQQAMMAEDTPGSSPVIGSQRPPNRVGFDVSHQSVQRPATTRRTTIRTEPQNGDELLSRASINLPLDKLSQMPGMPKRVAGFMKGAQPMSTLAQRTQQVENIITPTNTGFATMRLKPGHVYLNGYPSDNTVLDSGASFSMIAEEYVEACALEENLESCNVAFTTADGGTAHSTKMLKDATVHVGLSAYTLDLVVATAPKFDMLLGVDFLDSSGATIHMNKRQALLTGMMEGTLITQPVPICVGKGPGSPIRTILCVEHEDKTAGAQSYAEPATEQAGDKAVENPPTKPNKSSLVARLRDLDQIDSSNEAGAVLEPEQSQDAEKLMELAAAAQQAANTEAEEAQEFMNELRQFSRGTNEAPLQYLRRGWTP